MKQLDSIIEQVYDAALDPAAWHGLLADIASAVDAVAGFYAGLDIRHGRGAFWYAVGHEPGMQALYNERYLAIDPTLAHVIKMPGKAFACSDYLSDAEIAASRFHTEFLLPNGIRHVLSGVVSMQGSTLSFFGFQRHLGQPPFSPTETAVLQRLIPHFAKADQVAAKVSTVSAARRIAMAVLDRLDYGIVIVDQTGHVRMTNQRAEQWLHSGAVVRSLLGKVRLTNLKDNEALDSLVRAAAQADGGDVQAHAMETLAADGNTRVNLLVLPVSSDARKQLDDDGADVAIIISEPNQQRAMAANVLQNSYGLTAAETRVAMGLAGGRTQDELSAALFVSLATIKTHTQHIYRKIGIGRQVDLVRLIYGLPALF
ncbi:hypothetical protein GJ697_27205 [Pseudoduganella sp. FT25W]|uniref:HTH luxR-type domain-containing protein n=1 Tax=Duganella alba TaxID=2666081 RepID=A0A6L5QP87_9BURK|nr:helix-turn-helix transcriptional regulator [Duganella alba]MRX11519.1 hypothetical protein [Duganella alba]MRX19766.1 hypothetical protein [Duganella alba]